MIKKVVKNRFGDKLRAVREKKNITLKQVAYNAQVSESLVSQIERNKVSPSIDTLIAIANVLEIDLEYLFRDYKKDKNITVIRAEKRDSILLNQVKYHQLSVMPNPSDTHAIEAFLLEIEVGGSKGDIEYGHTGNELGVILSGKGELQYGTKTFDLNEGDSVSFPSDIPHTLRNIGSEILKAIWVITPPRMFFIK